MSEIVTGQGSYSTRKHGKTSGVGVGVYSETFGFGLSDNFHFRGGGILKLLDLDSDNFHFFGGGRYSETLRFGLSDNFHFHGGGILTLGFGLFDNFHFRGGGYSETVLQNRGYSGRIWTKISTTPAGSCITDSLSHTTYVETNEKAFSSQGKVREF